LASERRPLTPLILPRPLKKKFERKSVESRGAISACLRQLREDWRHTGLHTHKISGRKVNGSQVFAARVSKGDRVTFYWDGPALVIENHCTHKQVLG
jgi:hypothetical protein